MASTTLGSRQQEFLAQLLDDERALPGGWNAHHVAGMAIYRNAYRARLVDALRDTYHCTARWVGDDAFQQAAVHHVITHPPSSWTLDDVGEAFPDTLRELFAADPEVAELGWLEWAMHRCFVAADATPIDAAGFSAATASFEEDDWATMRLSFLPGTYLAPISHDVGALWKALKHEELISPDYSISAPLSCVVWREQLKPVFIQVDAAQGQALAMLLGGASYGEACNALIDLLGEEAAAIQAGAMLGRWLHHGMIAGVSQ
jgi:hypothetical protein